MTAISAGVTGSGFTRPLATITHGFNGPQLDDDPLPNRVHGPGESVGVKSPISGAKTMLALAYDILAAK